MAEVNSILVRHFFELNGFTVRSGSVLYVKKPPAGSAPAGDFLITGENIRSLACGAVIVKPWHSEVFSPSNIRKVLKDTGRLTESLPGEAEKILGTRDYALVLVLSKLPPQGETRRRSIAMLEEGGIDRACLFPEILDFLTGHVKKNINYSDDALQIIRILKCYGLCGAEQPELFKK